MTISATNTRVEYTGTGLVSTYAYTFYIFEATNLELKTYTPSTGVEATLAINVDYTVAASGVQNPAGGNITLTVALPLATVLTISRVMPLTQATSIRNQGAFYPENHEDEFDRLIMTIQQLKEELNRKVGNRKTLTSASFNPELPVVTAAGQLLGVNSTSNGLTWVSPGGNSLSVVTYVAPATIPSTVDVSLFTVAATSCTIPNPTLCSGKVMWFRCNIGAGGTVGTDALGTPVFNIATGHVMAVISNGTAWQTLIYV